ncbi:MAG: hypothetical protein JWM99_3926 [Verrucomicrobiales bacterium]|nr:hypothetical protein [Verrucomicrobiales bacterium]
MRFRQLPAINYTGTRESLAESGSDKSNEYKSMNINSCRWATSLMVSFCAAGWIQAASTIQFTAPTYTVAENAGAAMLSVRRTGDTSTPVSVDYATTDGTATNGLKYTAVSGTLAFGPSETNKTIFVPILNNGLVESSRTFRFMLNNPIGGAVLGALTNATVSIADNDVGVQFQFIGYSVAEDAGAVLIGVARGDDGVLPVTLDLVTTDLTAKSGLDYSGFTNRLSFAPQERLKFVSIPILNNSTKQPGRSFRVTLANPAGVTLGGQSTTMVTILDNDQGFQFQSASYAVAEDSGAALISVLRGTDETNPSVTVDYATSDGSATSGLAYIGITNTLSFAPGEKVKLIIVPILNDGVKETIRNFRLTLSNPAGGGVLGSPAATTISILDNDSGVGFESAHYTNFWGNADAITVNVLRGNDCSLEPITVDYSTSDLTARAGQDYQGASGTLQFQRNETVKSVTISLLRARAIEGTKSFRLTLTNSTGGAALGISSTTVSIVGSYFTLAPPFDTVLSIRRFGGLNTVTWAGAGLLQRADNPMGPWQTLAAAQSPASVQSPIPATFYQVTRPRLVNLYVPTGYDGQKPLPLVILLHGYTRTGVYTENYLRFQPLAETRSFLYCYPESLTDRAGNPFWNSSDACCDFWSTRVDDAGYLRALIQEIGRQFAVDRKRVFLVGWSNGGFMAYGMACQSADLIAGIASLAGTTLMDSSRCEPSQPVNILHIHGTLDSTVPYTGGVLTGFPANVPPFPGASQTIRIWAGYNRSTGLVTDAVPSLDLTTDVPGLDTVVTRYTNCPPGGAVELWTINGGGHGPTLSSQFSSRVIDWLLAHPKP